MVGKNQYFLFLNLISLRLKCCSLSYASTMLDVGEAPYSAIAMGVDLGTPCVGPGEKTISHPPPPQFPIAELNLVHRIYVTSQLCSTVLHTAGRPCKHNSKQS